MNNKKVGFIGGGNMAYAIAKGMIDSGAVRADDVIASARTEARLSTVWKDLQTRTTIENIEVVESSDVVFLAVKPYILPSVLDEIKCSGVDLNNKLFVSVATGVTIDFMEGKLGDKTRVIRSMPNTPCLVQSGVIVYSCGKQCLPEDSSLIKKLLSVIGYIEEVDENQIDAMTSLMGCSIGWFQLIIEALSDGGVMNRVPRQISYKLVAKAMEGSAKLFLNGNKHPGELKDAVSSPGGSTVVGLYELEQAGMRGILMRAVEAATKRNKELGNQ